jgi:16S rRNA (guanine966-N2)-methyltransferase
MIRIIAGSAKNQKINVPKNISRPLTDRIKTSLFDLIGQEVIDSTIIDVFAGSGAFGIEALSRGAKYAVFIEENYTAANVIRKNLDKLSFTEKSRIANKKAEDFFNKNISQQYSIVFLDPPFDMEFKNLEKILISASAFLEKNGLLIVRTTNSFDPPAIIKNNSSQTTTELVHTATYGKSLLSFYRPTA